MPIIVFASSKGGVGKTTTALTLASVLSHHGASTTLIDADKNTPLERWSKRWPNSVPEKLRVVSAHRDDVASEIDSSIERDPYVIVDLEGSKNEEVSVAIGRADLVLIPMLGTQLDVDEAGNVIKLIQKQEMIFRRSIPYRVFLSKQTVIVDRGMRDILVQLREGNIPLMQTGLVDRSAYRAPFQLGGTLYDLKKGEVSNPQLAVEGAEEFAKELGCVLRGEEYVRDVEDESEESHVG